VYVENCFVSALCVLFRPHITKSRSREPPDLGQTCRYMEKRCGQHAGERNNVLSEDRIWCLVVLGEGGGSEQDQCPYVVISCAETSGICECN